MRLIDADDLNEIIKKQSTSSLSKGLIEQFINSQPTAYDVDKVVEQLDEASEYYECENAPNGTDCQMVLLEQAMDIVKAGGVE